MRQQKKIIDLMKLALECANDAAWEDEVPVGCVIVDEDWKIISKASNLKERNQDVTGHAEILSIKEAAKSLGDWRLEGCKLIVTLEPCPMCLSAIIQSRIQEVYFGAYDKKGGALSLGYYMHKDQRLNHQVKISGGYLHFDCSKVLSDFFREKRKHYKHS